MKPFNHYLFNDVAANNLLCYNVSTFIGTENRGHIAILLYHSRLKMGEENALDPQEEVIAEEAEVITPELDENGEEVVVEAAIENEIVLVGDEGSRPEKQTGFQKRVNKLNARNEESVKTASDAETRATIAEERSKLLQMALDQRKDEGKANVPPDPNDFDDGVNDPGYTKKLNAYNQPLIDAAVQRSTSQISQQTQNDVANSNLEKMQTKHYERADELKMKDYEETEDKAISILGKDTANALIGVSDNSHLVLYHLGKNLELAEYFAELIKTNPLKATLELGALAGNMKVQRKGKTEPTPDPDEELQGGSPSAGQSNKHQRLVDSARKAVQNGGSMHALMEAKKNAKAAGVTIT